MADHDDPQTIDHAVAELEARVRHLHAEGRLSYDPTGDRWHADGQPVDDITAFTIDRLAVAGQLRPLAAVPAPSHEGSTPPPASPIPDQAEPREVPRAAFEAACADAGVHPLSDAAQVIHNALSAALPYLSTQDDTAALREENERLRAELAGMSDMAARARDHHQQQIATLQHAICTALGWDPQAPWPGNRAATEALAALRAGEFAGFYITADDGYPALTYYPHADEDGVHVRFADAGTSLDELVQAAREHAASRRGEQGE